MEIREHNYSTIFWTSQIAEVFKNSDADWNVVTEMAKELKQMDLSDFEIHYFIQNCGYKEIRTGVDNPIAKFTFNFENYQAREYMKGDYTE